MDLPIDRFDPIAHDLQAPCLRILLSCRLWIETASIILDHQENLTVQLLQADFQLCRTRVLQDIADRLLSSTEKSNSNLERQSWRSQIRKLSD